MSLLSAVVPVVVPALLAATTAPTTAPASPDGSAADGPGGIGGGLGGTPQLPRGLSPTDVSPGVAGFIATFAVVLVSVFLIINLNGRMRRIRHRAALEEARERAAQQADGGERSLDGRAAPAPLPSGGEVVAGEFRATPDAEREDPGTPGTRAT